MAFGLVGFAPVGGSSFYADTIMFSSEQYLVRVISVL